MGCSKLVLSSLTPSQVLTVPHCMGLRQQAVEQVERVDGAVEGAGGVWRGGVHGVLLPRHGLVAAPRTLHRVQRRGTMRQIAISRAAAVEVARTGCSLRRDSENKGRAGRQVQHLLGEPIGGRTVTLHCLLLHPLDPAGVLGQGGRRRVGGVRGACGAWRGLGERARQQCPLKRLWVSVEPHTLHVFIWL